MTWKWRKKKEGMFCTLHFVRRKFFQHVCFISRYSVLNTYSEYKYFYISKTFTSYTSIYHKITSNLHCILNINLVHKTACFLVFIHNFHRPYNFFILIFCYFSPSHNNFSSKTKYINFSMIFAGKRNLER